MTAPGVTLDELLRHGDSGPIPLDVDLAGSEDSRGPLTSFLQDRRGRALDLYLLLAAVSAGGNDAVVFPSAVWARALGIDDIASPEVQISRNWSWLEREGFVATERQGRLRSVRLVRGEPGLGGTGRVFWLSNAYFLGNYHNRVNLAGKVVLLAGLARGGRFSFISGPPVSWHGMSQETVKRGIRVLLTLGILRVDSVRVTDAMTAAGYRVERRYALQRPFVAPDTQPRQSR